MRVIFVRHGETDWNKIGRIQGRLDIGLNINGIRKAHYCKKKLQNYNVDAIYSSPQKRAYQTSEIINAAFNLPIRQSNMLQEIDLGTWQGLTWREVELKNRNLFMKYEKDGDFSSIYGGESWLDVQSRMVDFLDMVLYSPYENVVVVSHGGAIRMLLSAVMGLPISSRTNLDIYNLSLNVVRYVKEKKRWQVETINEHSYIGEMLDKKIMVSII